MTAFGLALRQFSRLSLSCTASSSPWSLGRHFTTQSTPLAFRATQVLASAPMKKRRKMDANLVIQKQGKKKRKIEKAIRRLEMKSRQLKPIEEIEGDIPFLRTVNSRKRARAALQFEESEDRALMLKQWGKDQARLYTHETKTISIAMEAQLAALEELRTESEELYQQAIQIDENLIPFHRKGPVHTPPVEGYDAPDGDYIDTTRKFDK